MIDFISSQEDRIGGDGNIGHGTHVAYVLLMPQCPIMQYQVDFSGIAAGYTCGVAKVCSSENNGFSKLTEYETIKGCHDYCDQTSLEVGRHGVNFLCDAP